jgi:hypothetical protein
MGELAVRSVEGSKPTAQRTGNDRSAEASGVGGAQTHAGNRAGAFDRRAKTRTSLGTDQDGVRPWPENLDGSQGLPGLRPWAMGMAAFHTARAHDKRAAIGLQRRPNLLEGH